MNNAPSESARDFDRLASGTLAPLLLCLGVAVVLAAQAWPAIPVAFAVALAAWGGALAMAKRPQRFLLSAVVYTPIVLLAMGSQLDAAHDSGSLLRELICAVDAGAAGALLAKLYSRAVTI